MMCKFSLVVALGLISCYLKAQQVNINISPHDVEEWTVDKNIFGKFFEPNGRDAYPGFISQHLANGSFEPWNEINNRHFRTEIIFDDIERTGVVAYPWEYDNEGRAWFELVEKGEHGQYFQKVINTKEGKKVSIYQRTALPDERTKEYQVKFLARADSGNTSLNISITNSERQELAHEVVILTDEWKDYTVALSLREITDNRYRKSVFGIYNLELSFSERAIVNFDHVQLIAGDAVKGKYNPTTLQRMKDFNVPSIRAFGGNYLSMYRWKDGIGPVDQRPISHNNEWGGLEPNYFGTNEFLEFCKLADIEPYFNVPFNLDIAPPEYVAQWVQYVNGDTTTAMGNLRKQHGFPEPWNVKHWQVGNEHYGIYQAGYIFPEAYAKNVVDYVKAMKAEDPSIKVFAAGADPAYEDQEGDEFNEILLDIAGAVIDGIDIHRYVNSRTISNDIFNSIDPVEKAHLFVAFPAQYEKILDELINDAKARNKEDLAITVGEWNMSVNVPGSGRVDYETMPHAAFVAGLYNVFMRKGKNVKFGHQRDNTLYFRPYHNDFRPVNPGNYVMKMYTEPFNEGKNFHLAKTSVKSPSFSHPKYGERFLAMKDVPFVDGVAMVTEDKNKVHVFITNRNINESYAVNLNIAGMPKNSKARVKEIYSDQVFAEQTSWYEKAFQEHDFDIPSKKGKISFEIKPASVVRLEFDLEKPIN